MTIPADQAVFRARRLRREGDVPENYLFTMELADDRSGQVTASCDLTGKASFTTVSIVDPEGRAWRMEPNRRIMPTRWAVSDPARQVAMQFDREIARHLANPLHKVILFLRDAEGKEAYRLVDPRTFLPDRILGVGPDDWMLVREEKPVAMAARLPKPVDRAGGAMDGIIGRLKHWIASSDRDWGIVSAGSGHALSAPVALGLLLILIEMTETASGGST